MRVVFQGRGNKQPIGVDGVDESGSDPLVSDSAWITSGAGREAESFDLFRAAIG